MREYRYILEPYKGMKTKHRCPNCEQNKRFTLYIDTETNENIHSTVGRCDRSDNCGYHYTPKQYFSDNNHLQGTPQLGFNFKPKALVLSKQINPSFIPVEVFKASLKPKAFETNHFVKFLIDLFGVEVASELVSRYFIGNTKYQFKKKEFPDYVSERGATVFWQLDTNGKVRTGKIMLYSPTTGKRIKEPFNHINWVHKVVKQPEFVLKQCLFGEHLLIDKTKPVAIVESEKTAVIASVYLPQFVWVAVGSLTNLNAEVCNSLKGRNIILYPDLKGFDKWSIKAKELSHLAQFTVSDLLERKASEADRKQGFDLADYLIKFDFKEFEKLTKVNIQMLKKVEIQNITKFVISEKENLIKPENWEQDITELENYFASIELPPQPIKLNQWSTITNCSLFIESHFTTLKANNGNSIFLPHLNRLQELKGIFQSSLTI